MAGAIATRMLLRSNSVSVLMPGYRKILHDKYGHDNVHVRSHGILTARPQYPEFSRRGNPEHRILAFGKWGTYKRLELMIDAFRVVAEALPNVKLVIAGGNHPQAPGYVESIKKSCAEDPKIEFTGYLDEDRLPDTFQSSSVAVMPYSSSTGAAALPTWPAPMESPSYLRIWRTFDRWRTGKISRLNSTNRGMRRT